MTVSQSQQQQDDDEMLLLSSLEYLKVDDIDTAYELLSTSFDQSARNIDPSQRYRPLSRRKITLGGGTTYTTEYKLRHDIEQLEYLLLLTGNNYDNGESSDGSSSSSSSSSSNTTSIYPPVISTEMASLITNDVLPTYRKVLERIPPLEDMISMERKTDNNPKQQQPQQQQQQLQGGLFPFSRELGDANGIMRYYNRALHIPDVNEYYYEDDKKIKIPIFNQDSIDPIQIQNQWNKNGIVVVDNILTPTALSLIRERIMWESTVWYQTKLPHKFGGYTGAYIDDGLHQRILLQLAIDLRHVLPTLLADHPLKYMWAYKYDSNYGGINLHADEAAVNVNMWLTPDDACIDKDSGGLVVYTVKPPDDWNFEQYNRDTDFVYQELIGPSGYANVTIPYKENRAVIFDSALFHTTDKFRFKKGYKNRRINLTLLYGEMQKKTSSPGGGGAKGSTNEEL